LNAEAESVGGGDEGFTLITAAGSTQYQFTLGAGTWLIQWTAPTYADAGQSQSRLINAGADGTGTAVLKAGSAVNSHDGGAETVVSIGNYIHSPSATNYYYIESKSATAVANGWGTYSGRGELEIFLQVTMQKLG
jgi:hypothetical protein